MTIMCKCFFPETEEMAIIMTDGMQTDRLCDVAAS